MRIIPPTITTVRALWQGTDYLQWFLLDSNDAEYSAARTALLGYPSSAEIGDAGHDSTLKVIRASITEDQLDADSNLVNCRTANFSSALCHDRYTSVEDWELRGRHVLGGTGTTVWYVRQEKYPTPSAHGDGTGKTHYDAAAGWNDTGVLGATFVRGDIYYGCGCNWAFRDGEAFASVNAMPAFPTGSGADVEWRMDHPLDPGMNYLGFVDRTTTSNTWTVPNPGSYPRVWKATLNNISGTGKGHFLLPIDPTLSTTDIYTNHLFGEGTSQADVEANAFTAWVNTGTNEMWVHMPDDTDPSHRIGRSNGFGFNPASKYMDASSPKKDFKFVNCQLIGGLTAGSGAMNGTSSTHYPRVKFLGGRYLFGTSWKPVKNADSTAYAGMEWGRSTDGFVLWDTSDRPKLESDTLLQKLVSRHGSNAAVWQLMDRFLEIDSAEEGIYWNGGGLADLPDGLLVSGVLARNIGSTHGAIKAKYGITVTFSDNDGHAWASQGLKNSTVEYIYIKNAYAAMSNYSIGDATSCQDNYNNTLQDFVVKDSGSDNTAFGAGNCGVQWPTGDADFGARTDGSGISTGNVIQRGVIDNIQSPNGSPGLDGYAIQGFGSQLFTVDNVTMSNCDFCITNAARNVTDTSYSDYDDTLDVQVKFTNCYFETPVYAFWRHRTVGWTTASPANTGYIDSNNNTYIYPSGDTHNVSTRFWTTGDVQNTYDNWVTAMTKASPPGAATTVLDPDSTFTVAS